MNEEMVKALTKELEQFKKNLPEYATQEDMKKGLDAIQVKIDDIGTDQLKADIDEIRTGVESLNTAWQEKQSKEIVKSLPEILTENKDQLKAIKEDGKGKISFEVPKTLVTRASVTDHTLAFRLSDVGQLAYKRLVMRDLFQTGAVGANSNGILRYVDQTANTRNADWTAEGLQKPESAITWQEYTLPIEKIADTIPVSMESLEDVDFVSSEINNLLLRNLAIKIDGDLYSGTGVSPIIFGAYTRADTYSPVASGITDANVYDLIVKVQEAITAATQYNPNYAVMNHALYNQMVLKKDGENNYVRPPFVNSADFIQVVNGIAIIVTASATTNTMLVGDFDFATLYNIGGIRVDMGFIDKQFVENTITLRAEERLGMLIRNAHQDAFNKVTDVAAALVTIAS